MVLSALGFSAMQLCSSLCADIPAMEQVFFRNVMAVALYALVWEKGRPPPRHAARAAVSHRLEPLRLPERRVPLHRGQGRRPGQPHDNRPHERLPRRRARGRIPEGARDRDAVRGGHPRHSGRGHDGVPLRDAGLAAAGADDGCALLALQRPRLALPGAHEEPGPRAHSGDATSRC